MPPSRSPYSYDNGKSKRYNLHSYFTAGTCLSLVATIIALINVVQFISQSGLSFRPENGVSIARSLLHSNCKDFHPECPFQAQQGLCQQYPSNMALECPHSCSTCDLLDPAVRCTNDRLYPDPDDLPPSFSEVYQPGNSLFKPGEIKLLTIIIIIQCLTSYIYNSMELMIT